MSSRSALRMPPLMAVPLPQRLAAEGLRTMLILIFGPGAAVISAHQGGSITLEGVAACNGLIVLGLIYALGHVSGAHFNPGVTLSFALFRHFQPREVAPYWSMNPARSFGPALVAGDLSNVWIYLVAPPLGAVIGALSYTLVRGDHT